MPAANVLNVLPFRILSFYEEAKQLLAGAMPYPRMAVLHANYTCNHNCQGCDYADLNHHLRATMTRQQARRLVEQICDMRIHAVELAGGGEPTLDPNFNYLVDAFHSNGIALGLLTNGSLLQGRLLRKVIEKFSYVRVSLESGTPEVFTKVKGINNTHEFYRVTKNTRNAVALRRKLGSQTVINVKFTVGMSNYQDMENGILLALDMGVDSIQFSLFENVGCKLNGTPAITVNYILDSLKREYEDRIKVLGSLLPTTLNGKCWLNPVFVVIDALGDVYACTYYRHRRDRHCLGNLFKDSLREIWLSPNHTKVIENIDPNECNVYHCRFHRYNEIMSQLLSNGKHDLEFI